MGPAVAIVFLFLFAIASASADAREEGPDRPHDSFRSLMPTPSFDASPTWKVRFSDVLPPFLLVRTARDRRAAHEHNLRMLDEAGAMLEATDVDGPALLAFFGAYLPAAASVKTEDIRQAAAPLDEKSSTLLRVLRRRLLEKLLADYAASSGATIGSAPPATVATLDAIERRSGKDMKITRLLPLALEAWDKDGGEPLPKPLERDLLLSNGTLDVKLATALRAWLLRTWEDVPSGSDRAAANELRALVLAALDESEERKLFHEAGGTTVLGPAHRDSPTALSARARLRVKAAKDAQAKLAAEPDRATLASRLYERCPALPTVSRSAIAALPTKTIALYLELHDREPGLACHLARVPDAVTILAALGKVPRGAVTPPSAPPPPRLVLSAKTRIVVRHLGDLSSYLRDLVEATAHNPHAEAFPEIIVGDLTEEDRLELDTACFALLSATTRNPAARLPRDPSLEPARLLGGKALRPEEAEALRRGIRDFERQAAAQRRPPLPGLRPLPTAPTPEELAANLEHDTRVLEEWLRLLEAPDTTRGRMASARLGVWPPTDTAPLTAGDRHQLRLEAGRRYRAAMSRAREKHALNIDGKFPPGRSFEAMQTLDSAYYEEWAAPGKDNRPLAHKLALVFEEERSKHPGAERPPFALDDSIVDKEFPARRRYSSSYGYGTVEWAIDGYRGDGSEADSARALLYDLASRRSRHALENSAPGTAVSTVLADRRSAGTELAAGKEIPEDTRARIAALLVGCPELQALPIPQRKRIAELPLTHLDLLESVRNHLSCQKLGDVLRAGSPRSVVAAALGTQLPAEALLPRLEPLIGKIDSALFPRPITPEAFRTLIPSQRNQVRSLVIEELLKALAADRDSSALFVDDGRSLALLYLLQHVLGWPPVRGALTDLGFRDGTDPVKGRTHALEAVRAHAPLDTLIQELFAWRQAPEERRRYVEEVARETATTPERLMLSSDLRIALLESGIDDVDNGRFLAQLRVYAPAGVNNRLLALLRTQPFDAEKLDRELVFEVQMHLHFGYEPPELDPARAPVFVASNEWAIRAMLDRLKGDEPFTNAQFLRLFDRYRFHLMSTGERLETRWERYEPDFRRKPEEFLARPVSAEDRQRLIALLEADELRLPFEKRWAEALAARSGLLHLPIAGDTWAFAPTVRSLIDLVVPEDPIRRQLLDSPLANEDEFFLAHTFRTLVDKYRPEGELRAKLRSSALADDRWRPGAGIRKRIHEQFPDGKRLSGPFTYQEAIKVEKEEELRKRKRIDPDYLRFEALAASTSRSRLLTEQLLEEGHGGNRKEDVEVYLTRRLREINRRLAELEPEMDPFEATLGTDQSATAALAPAVHDLISERALLTRHFAGHRCGLFRPKDTDRGTIVVTKRIAQYDHNPLHFDLKFRMNNDRALFDAKNPAEALYEDMKRNRPDDFRKAEARYEQLGRKGRLPGGEPVAYQMLELHERDVRENGEKGALELGDLFLIHAHRYARIPRLKYEEKRTFTEDFDKIFSLEDSIHSMKMRAIVWNIGKPKLQHSCAAADPLNRLLETVRTNPESVEWELTELADRNPGKLDEIRACVDPLPDDAPIKSLLWKAAFPPSTRPLFKADFAPFQDLLGEWPTKLCLEYWARELTYGGGRRDENIGKTYQELEAIAHDLKKGRGAGGDGTFETKTGSAKAALDELLDQRVMYRESRTVRQIRWGQRPDFARFVGGDATTHWRSIDDLRAELVADLAFFEKAAESEESALALEGLARQADRPRVARLLHHAAYETDARQLRLVRQTLRKALVDVDAHKRESVGQLLEPSLHGAEGCRHDYAKEGEPVGSASLLRKSRDFLLDCQDSPNLILGDQEFSGKNFSRNRRVLGLEKVEGNPQRETKIPIPAESEFRLNRLSFQARGALELLLDESTTNVAKGPAFHEGRCAVLWTQDFPRLSQRGTAVYEDEGDRKERRFTGHPLRDRSYAIARNLPRYSHFGKDRLARLILNPTSTAVIKTLWEDPELKSLYIDKLLKDSYYDRLLSGPPLIDVPGIGKVTDGQALMDLHTYRPDQIAAVQAWIDTKLEANRNRPRSGGHLRLLTLLARLPAILQTPDAHLFDCRVPDPLDPLQFYREFEARESRVLARGKESNHGPAWTRPRPGPDSAPVAEEKPFVAGTAGPALRLLAGPSAVLLPPPGPEGKPWSEPTPHTPPPPPERPPARPARSAAPEPDRNALRAHYVDYLHGRLPGQALSHDRKFSLPYDWNTRFDKLSADDLRQLQVLERLLTHDLPAQGAGGTRETFEWLLEHVDHAGIVAAMRVYAPDYQKQHLGEELVSRARESLKARLLETGELFGDAHAWKEFEMMARATLAKRVMEDGRRLSSGSGSPQSIERLAAEARGLFGFEGRMNGPELQEIYFSFRREWLLADKAQREELAGEHPFLAHLLAEEQRLRNEAMEQYLVEYVPRNPLPDPASAVLKNPKAVLSFRPPEHFTEDFDIIVDRAQKILGVNEVDREQVPEETKARLKAALAGPDRLAHAAWSRRWQRNYCGPDGWSEVGRDLQTFTEELADEWSRERARAHAQAVRDGLDFAGCMKPHHAAQRGLERQWALRLGRKTAEIQRLRRELALWETQVHQITRLRRFHLPKKEFDALPEAERTPERKNGKVSELESAAMGQYQGAQAEGYVKHREAELAKLTDMLARFERERKAVYRALSRAPKDFEQLTLDTEKAIAARKRETATAAEACRAKMTAHPRPDLEGFLSRKFTEKYGAPGRPGPGSPFAGDPFAPRWIERHLAYTARFIRHRERGDALARVLAPHPPAGGLDRDSMYQQWKRDAQALKPCGDGVGALERSFAATLSTETEAAKGRRERTAALLQRLASRWGIHYDGDRMDLTRARFHAGSWPELKADLDGLTELTAHGGALAQRYGELADQDLLGGIDYAENLLDQAVAIGSRWEGANAAMNAFSTVTLAETDTDVTVSFSSLGERRKQYADLAQKIEKEIHDNENLYTNYRIHEDQWAIFKYGPLRRAFWTGDDKDYKKKDQAHKDNLEKLLVKLEELGAVDGGEEFPLGARDLVTHYRTQYQAKALFDRDYVQHEIWVDSRERDKQLVAVTVATTALFVPGGQSLALDIALAYGWGVLFHEGMGVSQTAAAQFGFGEAARVGNGGVGTDEMHKTGLMFAIQRAIAGPSARAAGTVPTATEAATGSTAAAAKIAGYTQRIKGAGELALASFASDTVFNVVTKDKSWGDAATESLLPSLKMGLLGFHGRTASRIPGLRNRAGYFLDGSLHMLGYDHLMIAWEMHGPDWDHQALAQRNAVEGEARKRYLVHLQTHQGDSSREKELLAKYKREIWTERYRDRTAANWLLYLHSGYGHIAQGRIEEVRRDVERVGSKMTEADKRALGVDVKSERTLELPDVMKLHGEPDFREARNLLNRTKGRLREWFLETEHPTPEGALTPEARNLEVQQRGLALVQQAVGTMELREFRELYKNATFRDGFLKSYGVSAERFERSLKDAYDHHSGALWLQPKFRPLTPMGELLPKLQENIVASVKKDIGELDQKLAHQNGPVSDADRQRREAILGEMRDLQLPHWYDRLDPSDFDSKLHVDAAAQFCEDNGFHPGLFMARLLQLRREGHPFGPWEALKTDYLNTRLDLETKIVSDLLVWHTLMKTQGGLSRAQLDRLDPMLAQARELDLPRWFVFLEPEYLDLGRPEHDQAVRAAGRAYGVDPDGLRTFLVKQSGTTLRGMSWDTLVAQFRKSRR